MDNIIKNPTFIAVVAGVIVYTYIMWKKKQNNKLKKNKKNKDNINEVLVTGIVVVIVWLIAFSYINYKTQPNVNPLENNQAPTYKLVKEISESPKSFTMLNPVGGIVFPTNNIAMPDLFMDNL